MSIFIWILWLFLRYGLMLIGLGEAHATMLYTIPLVLISPRIFNAKPAQEDNSSPMAGNK